MGRIFDIKRYAIHDGPGVRVTVFLKGCPLRCAWCHNPEGISSGPQLSYTHSRCIACGECVRACPNGACSLTATGVLFNRDTCVLCGRCAGLCPTLAIELVGEERTVADIVAEVEKDRVLIDQSAGGVTFSGGEPLSQPEFLIDLLNACAERGLHRVVDTSGYAPTATLLKVADRADMFLFDLKLAHPERHREWTGVASGLILKNLQALAETGVEIEMRIPLIEGVNTDEENIERTAAFIAGLAGAAKVVRLLPYHDIATSKYRRLGTEAELIGLGTPLDAVIRRVTEQFEAHGVEAVAGRNRNRT